MARRVLQAPSCTVSQDSVRLAVGPRCGGVQELPATEMLVCLVACLFRVGSTLPSIGSCMLHCAVIGLMGWLGVAEGMARYVLQTPSCTFSQDGVCHTVWCRHGGVQKARSVLLR